MALEAYRRKRHFEKTPEPSGKEAPSRRDRVYVIQKHAASHLHYDLRLELQGVLKSWAVPKGPSLNPAQKRLAVHVEDHPLEYADFEGVIPRGEYGGGTVEVWDKGTWAPESDDPQAAYEHGKLAFTLNGKKLRGRWALVRTKRQPETGKENWLLIKEKDNQVRTDGEDILKKRPESVLTGRRIEQIAEEESRVWRSASEEGPAGEAKVPDPSRIRGAKKAKEPEWTEPELATLVKEPPRGDGWLHEIKFDGYRMISRLENGAVRIFSRRDNDWTAHFPSVAEEVAKLPAAAAILDGEIVALEPDGRSSFGLLQEALSRGDQSRIVCFLFDLLYLDGYDLRNAPLVERKKALRQLLAARAEPGKLRYTEDVRGLGEEFFKQTCGFALEGAVSKKLDSPYTAGRGKDWLKEKCLERQEFVIGGYTDPAGGRVGFGALLVGVYDNGELQFAGKVGTGFSDKLLVSLWERMRGIEQDGSPFADEIPTDLGRKAHWVRPELVCEVAFTEWTRDGMLRHPSFQGLREDKNAKDVIREEPIAAAKLFPPAHQGPGGSRREHKPPPKLRKVSVEKNSIEGVELTHPDRVYYPDEGITKAELAGYYAEVGAWILPHVSKRPLTLIRCPEGWKSECFYQKQASEEWSPDFVKRIRIEFESTRSGERELNNAWLDSLRGVIYLVQMGVLEFHTWSSSVRDIERPDRMVFDLDPAEDVGLEAVVEAAKKVRDRLALLGLTSFCKTTGGKGYHVVVPIKPKLGWDEVSAFARAVAQDIVKGDPAKYTATMSKAKRRGRVFVDYLRTTRGATAVSAYSSRRKQGAPVSVPLRWEELSKTAPNEYTIRSLARRLAHLRADPWEDYQDVQDSQSITSTMKRELGL